MTSSCDRGCGVVDVGPWLNFAPLPDLQKVLIQSTKSCLAELDTHERRDLTYKCEKISLRPSHYIVRDECPASLCPLRRGGRSLRQEEREECQSSALPR